MRNIPDILYMHYTPVLYSHFFVVTLIMYTELHYMCVVFMYSQSTFRRCFSVSLLVILFYYPFSSDQAKFREDLLNIARTTLSSKLLVHHRDHFAKLAVDAVLRLKVQL